MSSTDCPNCGCSRYPDPNGHCPDCNFPPLRRLTLTGEVGSLSFGVRTCLGSALLLRLSAEAQYAERDEQFSVCCRDSDWFVLPRTGTRNATLLNGAIIKGESLLKNGDVITLGSQAGSKRQVMRLLVGMVDT